jgi:toxin ParE1/3/4
LVRIVRTARAGEDLEEIWLHVAYADPAAADRLIDRIASRCLDLMEYPHLGPARTDIAPEARMLVLDDYIILTRVVAPDVEIVRIVHGARRLQELIDILRN